MGNKLLVQKQDGRFNDPATFFIKYYNEITFIKTLRIKCITLGDNKLFKTVLGSIENNGPVVVKTYLVLISNFNKTMIDELNKYQKRLEHLKKTLDLLHYPNVMPYQSLKLDKVFFFC